MNALGMRTILGTAVVSAVVACGSEPSSGVRNDSPIAPAPVAAEETLTSFEGVFDAKTNELDVTFSSPAGQVIARERGGLHSLATLPEGSGSDHVIPHTIPGSVHYETAGTYSSCASGNPGDAARLCGNVQIQSSYATSTLSGVSVVIDSVSGTGNAAFGAPFAYTGTIAANGTSNTIQWTFSLATPASFSFKGHVTGTVNTASYTSCAAVLAANPSATTGTYTIAPNGTPISAYCEMATLGGGWTQVLDDDVTVAGYPAKSVWAGPYNATEPNGGRYSILNLLPQVHSGTNYTFYMVYEGRGYQSWTQTANPTAITSGYPTFVGSPTFNPSPQGCDAVGVGAFSGLFVSSGPDSYLTADSRNRSSNQWWFAVGEVTAFGAGIPAFNGTNTSRVRLYVQ